MLMVFNPKIRAFTARQQDPKLCVIMARQCNQKQDDSDLCAFTARQTDIPVISPQVGTIPRRRSIVLIPPRTGVILKLSQ